MVATVTKSTNNRYWSVEGTIAEVIGWLDSENIPQEDIIDMGYSGITNKIFFAFIRRTRS